MNAYSWIKTTLTFSLFFALTSCLFSTQETWEPRESDFDLSPLENLSNPLTNFYQKDPSKNFTGLKFAFRSTQYPAFIDSSIDTYTSLLGRRVAFAGAYFDISSHPANLESSLKALRAKGLVPYITLDPKDFDNPDQAENIQIMPDILAGKYDSFLSQWADVFNEFSDPIMFRFAHEMNGNWYPYSGIFQGANKDSNSNGQWDGPENYQRVWRYIHQKFTEKNVTNLIWIYCPNFKSFPKEEWNQPFHYYPGNDYVDLIFVDVYENSEEGTIYLDSLLKPFFNDMALFYESQEAKGQLQFKSFGLGELGTYDTDLSRKGLWYKTALKYLIRENKIQFHAIYNDVNNDKNFKIDLVSEPLKIEYENPRFSFNLAN